MKTFRVKGKPFLQPVGDALVPAKTYQMEGSPVTLVFWKSPEKRRLANWSLNVVYEDGHDNCLSSDYGFQGPIATGFYILLRMFKETEIPRDEVYDVLRAWQSILYSLKTGTCQRIGVFGSDFNAMMNVPELREFVTESNPTVQNKYTRAVYVDGEKGRKVLGLSK